MMKNIPFICSCDHCVTKSFCRSVRNPKTLAICAGIYSINIAILVIMLYSWRLSINIQHFAALEEVYYGVQIAYLAIIGVQFLTICISICLLIGIYTQNVSLLFLWIIGSITFIALDAVAMVYANVLRDHINKKFDTLCKAEVAFYITRSVISVIAIGGVRRYSDFVKRTDHWKQHETIEL